MLAPAAVRHDQTLTGLPGTQLADMFACLEMAKFAQHQSPADTATALIVFTYYVQFYHEIGELVVADVAVYLTRPDIVMTSP